ncbi:ATPase domain-containing protein [Halorarius halobius]|uniref:ATPase domain-containing protein n=1 Tax=Halorarius halobius TaxID=2962671 RepID=UPI0020CE7ECD|nr:ATPase domain-containing protein [Halorarius halobius]
MTDAYDRRLSTGIDGLDTVLNGGLFPNRAYMATGDPGTGKTLLGLHFLTAGRDAGETGLFVNLEETATAIERNAASFGVDMDGIEFLDLTPDVEAFTGDESYSVFSPAEVEGADIAGSITDSIDSIDPDRVFVDPITQLRMLAPDEYQFRKQVTGLVQLLKGHDATVLFASEATESKPDDDLRYLSDGTLELTRAPQGRRIAVPKLRGSETAHGPHTVRITDAGMEVFPVLTPGEHTASFAATTVSSGVPEVDELLKGGLERGTVTVLSGPSGVGKTTLGTQFMKEAAGRGERSVIYMFEESTQTFVERSRHVNIPVTEMCDRGTLAIEEVEPSQVSPDEFADMVRTEVEARDAKLVMIDGIEGYRLSLRGDDDDLTQELNALGRYLRNMGVTVVLVDAVDSVTGDFQATKSGVSYLADNLVFLRYLELQGELRKAIGILKNRTSDFERTLREFEITRHGIKVGEPLQNMRGILSGTPEFVEDRPAPANTGDRR